MPGREQRHREPQPLLLAAGALGHPPSGDGGDPGVLEHLVDRLGVGEQAGGVLDGLADLRSLSSPPVCITARDQAARDGLAGAVAEDLDLAGGRLGEPEDHVDGRGLAGAVGAEERHDLALLELQVDAAHGVHGAEVLGHARVRPGHGGCRRGRGVRRGSCALLVRRERHETACVDDVSPRRPAPSGHGRWHDKRRSARAGRAGSEGVLGGRGRCRRGRRRRRRGPPRAARRAGRRTA